MKIAHLSVSRSHVWFECEQKYKYKYHLEIPSMIVEPPYFTYGKAIHKIIEVFTEQKGVKNIFEIKNQVVHGEILLDNKKLDLDKLLPDSYKKRFKPELESFLRLTDKLGFGGESEWGFSMDLEPPKNKIMYGIIDRLIEKNGQFIIIDYKTTQKGSPWRKNEKNITADLQLQCYARVVMEYFKVDPKNIKTALYYLSGGELIGANFTTKTLENLGEKMLQTYDLIANKDPSHVQGNVGSHCKRCEYAQICPFFNPLQRIYGKKEYR